MSRLAIMQPYFFPYMGYFSLLSRVDRFVFLDNVNFPKKGWVNRNFLLISGEVRGFSVPLSSVSQNKFINEIALYNIDSFRDSFLKTLYLNYHKYPFYNQVADLVGSVLGSSSDNISDLACRSIEAVAQYLQFRPQFSIASRDYPGITSKGQNRILEICLRSNVDVYVNAEGGQALYDSSEFERIGVKLEVNHYSERACANYFRVNGHLVSSIDTLMRLSPEKIRSILLDDLP